jgi:hypothetical protein
MPAVNPRAGKDQVQLASPMSASSPVSRADVASSDPKSGTAKLGFKAPDETAAENPKLEGDMAVHGHVGWGFPS